MDLGRFTCTLLLLSTLWGMDAASAATREVLDLDGLDDRVVVAHDRALNPGTGITIEAWVRHQNPTACQTIVGKDFRTSWWLGLCGGRIRFYTSGQLTSVDDDAVIPQGVWTHVAVTFNGFVRRYYINGNLALSQTTPAPMPANLADIGIGGEATGTCGGGFCELHGQLSEVRLWNLALPMATIRHNMIRRLSRPEPGLIAVWPMEMAAVDAVGGFDGVRQAGARFLGLNAPPTVHEPLQIPRLSAAPVIDGSCTGSYGLAATVPIWLAPSAVFGTPNPTFAKIGATASNLYVCVDRITMGETGSRVLVHLDGLGDGGNTPNSDDWRFTLFQGGATSVEQGTGDGVFMPWASASLSGFAAARPASEFEWSAEFRIPRSAIPTAGVETFLLDTVYRFADGGTLDSFGWPDDNPASVPSTWEPVVIDDTPPPADSFAPNVNMLPPIMGTPTDDDAVMFRARATDDVDLQKVEIFVSADVFSAAVPVHVCEAELAGSDDRFLLCTYTEALPTGMVQYAARAVDHVGKVGWSEIKTLRVVSDATPPRISLRQSVASPLLGQSVTVTADAADESGIQWIIVRDSFGSAFRRCDFPSSPTAASCALTLTPTGSQRLMKYSALARDVEDFQTETPLKTVLFGNTGTDTDGDGIVDQIEEMLCTSPFSLDTDRDSLRDDWEVLGIRFDDGTSTDLPAQGANPCRPDVFLQFDYERGAELPETGFDTVVNEFRANGVELHLEVNERPRPPTADRSPLWAEAAAQQVDADGTTFFDPRRQWTHFYGYSRHVPGRSGGAPGYFSIDRYLGADDCACPLDTSDPSSCGLPRDGTNCRRSPDNDITYRFMHELGHAMGLGHGGRIGTRNIVTRPDGFFFLDNGWESTNYKPNHRSVMDYGFGISGPYCAEPPAAGDTGPRFIGELTFDDGALPQLDESSLDERPTSAFATALQALDCGPAASAAAVPVVQYTCLHPTEPGLAAGTPRRYRMVTDGRRTWARVAEQQNWDMSPPGHAPGIDWNCDGAISSSRVSSSINGSGSGGGNLFAFPGEACNGTDDNGDGAIDEGCAWAGSETFAPMREWQGIPNKPSCHLIYRGGDQCYVHRLAYRAGIPDLLDGVPVQDCRPAGEPGVDCGTTPFIDFTASSGETAGVQSVPVARADARGAEPTGSGLVEHVDGEVEPVPPNLEICNGNDDDGDLVVDESCADSDMDLVVDALDNCRFTPNNDQADSDHDRVGDACASPVVDGLSAIYGDGRVTLQWSADSPDITGFSVYRSDRADASPVYLGGGFPTTGEAGYVDTGVGGTTTTYHVHALNPAMEEGPAATVVVGQGVMFRDGFEN